MNLFIRNFFVLIFSLLLSLNVYADIQLNGFASFVGGTTLENGDSYGGYENTLEYQPNSLYGLQVMANLDDGLMAIAQVMSRANENHKPELEWAYMSYNLTPTLNAKMGRIRTPFYMFSEYLEVGYTHLWIRPPVELYAGQITNMDGVSFLYNLPIGPIDSQYMVVIGNRRGFDEGATVTTSDYKPLYGLNAQFEYTNYITKFIYTQGDITYEQTGIDAAVTGFTGLDSDFAKDHVAINNSTVIFAGIGFDINFHPMRFILEYSSIEFDELLLIPDETRTLVSGQFSFGDAAVGYAYSQNKKEPDDSVPGEINPAFEALAVGSLPNKSEVNTHTLSFRYDFHDSAAAKVELISSEDAEVDDSDAVLMRFGIDMIF